MKYIKYSQKQEEGDGNVFWVTMSDLLLGLMVVFLVLFVFTFIGFSQRELEKQKTNYDVSEELAQALEQKHVKVEIDKFSGRIKISDLELFELNSWELSDKGREYLSKFVPVYFDTILKNPKIKENISQIIIEGHTDSHTFIGANSPEMRYYKNMDLSIKRASSVAEYIVFANYQGKKTYENEMFKLLSVQGKGSSEPIIVNGKEDFAKSRRVELKIMFKDDSILDAIQKK